MNSSSYKILLVDDEPDILEFLGYNLKREGYTVFVASNGKEAISVAKKEIPELVVLDIMMPEMDGMEVCRELRKISGLSNMMIAFLTARSEDYSQITGLDSGADDYIAKPIKPNVFVSRVKALLRRISKPSHANIVEAGGVKIDREKHLVTKDDKKMFLPKKEFELLYLLVSKPGNVFRREDILKLVWGGDVVVGDRTIDVHIRKLREKIGGDYIRTVKGVGYKFEF